MIRVIIEIQNCLANYSRNEWKILNGTLYRVNRVNHNLVDRNFILLVFFSLFFFFAQLLSFIMYKERRKRPRIYVLFVDVHRIKATIAVRTSLHVQKVQLSCRTYDLVCTYSKQKEKTSVRSSSGYRSVGFLWICRDVVKQSVMFRTVSVNQLDHESAMRVRSFRHFVQRGKRAERIKRGKKRGRLCFKDEHGGKRRKKGCDEAAWILFAIKARDNLKAITITHGLRECATSLSISLSHLCVCVLRPCAVPLLRRICESFLRDHNRVPFVPFRSDPTALMWLFPIFMALHTHLLVTSTSDHQYSCKRK